jgi:hypothetical protein
LSPRFVRRPAALIAVLALAAGVAAAAPAAHASITPACVWQSLYLLNGWQSAQTSWNTGDPEYCVDNGIVYLSGSLKNPTNAGHEFAVLPPQALPTSRLDLLAYTYDGTIGQLIIGPDGAMYADGSDADQYTSLAGVSFPVAGTALTPLPLYPGWHSGQAQFGAGNPGYVITDGIVHWTGSLTTTNTPNTGYPGNYFAMVPGAAHADRCLNATVYTYGDHVGNMAIWPPSTVFSDRDMFVSDTPGGTTSYYASFTSLAGISYPADGTATWQPLNLQDGWAEVTPSSYCQYYPSAPSYYVQGHVAYLIGWIQQNQAGSEFVGTLPAIARPVHDLYMIVGPDGYLHISPNGNMYVFGETEGWVRLDTIAYQTSS